MLPYTRCNNMSSTLSFWTIGRDLLVDSQKNVKVEEVETKSFEQHKCEYCVSNTYVATVRDSTGVSHFEGQEPYSLVCTPCMNLYCNTHGSQRKTLLPHRSGPTDFVCVGCVSIRVCKCGDEFTAPFDQALCDKCDYENAVVQVVLQVPQQQTACATEDHNVKDTLPQPFCGSGWMWDLRSDSYKPIPTM